MAIPKKGSRKIVVDGVEYRWYIRRNNKEDGMLSVAIETASNESASILYVTFPVLRPDSLTAGLRGDPKSSVTPNDIATYIRDALVAGWQPLQSGSPFVYKPNTQI
jgi:hypothetical protein